MSLPKPDGSDKPKISLETEQEKQGLIYAIRLLAATKRSERNIRERMTEKGYPASAIDKVITVLKAGHYLNDLALAKQKIEYAALSAPKGRRRLSFELRQKGIGERVIQDALAEYLPEEELSHARTLAQGKWADWQKIEQFKRRKKLYDFLARRGFDYELCRQVIDEVERAQA